MARKIVVEIEVPEGKTLEELLRGVNFRVVDPLEELEEIIRSAKRKRRKLDRIPKREEIYADRARY